MPAKEDRGRKAEAARPAPSGQPGDADGVDVTLIRWMLSLTPAERLQVLQSNVRSIQRLRDARSGD